MTNGRISRRRFLAFAGGLAAPQVLLHQALAQQYPAHVVRIVVPLSAGSASDTLARQIAAKMSAHWGQSVIVENRPGAGTTLGADLVAKASPDGHTLLLTSAGFAASAAVYAKLPYDPLKDLAPVSQIGTAPLVVVAAPSLGAKSIKDLIDIAKARPEGINFGSAGVGSSTHFAGEQFKLAAGLNATHVPYKGPPEALLDTMTGRIQYCLSPVLPALPHIKDGKLLALGVTTGQRSAILPDVPAVAEAGLQGYDYQDWWGLFAPAGTPAPVIEQINKEAARVLGLPEIAKQLLVQGAEVKSSRPDEFRSFVQAKVESARQIAKSAGIRAN